MGARHVPHALKGAALALTCLVAGAEGAGLAPGSARGPGRGAQEEPSAADLAAHSSAAGGERTERYLAARELAPPELVASAERAIEARRTPGSSVTSAPSLETLDQATRLLSGRLPESEDLRVLAQLADGLDLRVVPGVFEPRSEGLGEALTVNVSPLYGPDRREDVVLTLLWLAPDGRELPARSEPVAARAFRRPGFPMYVRPPASEPGLWHLVAEVAVPVREGWRARGVPVPVECVRDFRARLQALVDRELVEPPAQAERSPDRGPELSPGVLIAHSLLALQAVGARSMVGLPPSRMLALAEGGAQDEASPLPAELAWIDGVGRAHWTWVDAAPDEAPPSRVLLLLAPLGERPEQVLTGVRGELWRETARRHGARLASTHLPGGLSPEAARTVLEILSGLRRRFAPAELIVVARGDTFARMYPLLQADELPFDALVVSTVVIGTSPAELLPGTPRLFVAPGGAERLAIDPEGELAWVDGAAIPFLDEPRLPGLVARWLEERGGR